MLMSGIVEHYDTTRHENVVFVDTKVKRGVDGLVCIVVLVMLLGMIMRGLERWRRLERLRAQLDAIVRHCAGAASILVPKYVGCDGRD